jgi:hypothetical protein
MIAPEDIDFVAPISIPADVATGPTTLPNGRSKGRRQEKTRAASSSFITGSIWNDGR